MDRLTFLPPEIAHKIISCLEVRDVINLQGVSKYWYHQTNHDRIWKQLWDIDIPLKECRRREFNWMFDKPCKWKLYYFIHQRVIRNWREGRFSTYEIDGTLMYFDAYDGQTLIVYNEWFVIYRVENGHLVLVQKIMPKTSLFHKCATNTKYIIVDVDSLMFVYSLGSKKYKFSHKIYFGANGQELLFSHSYNGNVNNYGNESMYWSPYMADAMHIIGDVLFFYAPGAMSLYAWDLKNKKCLMESINEKIDKVVVVNDKARFYVASNQRVSVYNGCGSLILNIQSPWAVQDFFVNRKIILCTGGQTKNKVAEVCIWNKFTGQELLCKNLVIGDHCVLHPSRSIMFGIRYRGPETTEIHALDLLNNVTLWKTDVQLKLRDGMHGVIADSVLLFNDDDLWAYSAKSGTFLYKIPNMPYGTCRAYYDIFIDERNWAETLKVHIYS